MKNKILLLVSDMNFGGAERVSSTLANAWVSAGKQVTLMATFSGRGECLYQLSSGVRFVYLADLVSSRVKTLGNRISRLLVLRRFIAAERPEVVVSFLPNVNVAAIIASIGLRVPVIICERTNPFVRPASYFWRLACRLAYPLADALMVQTQVVADKYLSLGWGLRRVRIIPNPVLQQMIEIKRFTGNPVAKRILSIGRLENPKQFNILIKIFARLAKVYPDWMLRIVGEGSLRDILQKQIVDLGLTGRVDLVGRSTTIGDEFAEADIFVLTSKYEGFPNTLLEAMTVGLPCVTFDCPSGPREISLDGKVALLVPPNDEHALGQALKQVMLNADLRKTLGICARASVMERFSLDKILKCWDDLFEEVKNKI